MNRVVLLVRAQPRGAIRLAGEIPQDLRDVAQPVELVDDVWMVAGGDASERFTSVVETTDLRRIVLGADQRELVREDRARPFAEAVEYELLCVLVAIVRDRDIDLAGARVVVQPEGCP